MIQNKDIFNINKSVLPFTREELGNSINKSVVKGYIPVGYDFLITKLQEISRAPDYQVTLNPTVLYMGSNNPTVRNDVLIEVEGIQLYNEFVNGVISGDESGTWTSFLSYSETFKDSVKNIKLNAYKKFLWNYHNIDGWTTSNNVSLISSDKNTLISDFNSFTERVLNSDDYISFINNCLDADVEKAINYIIKQGVALLKKHSTELNQHIYNNNRKYEQIKIKNPIITKIYVMSSLAGRCRKDWPKLKIIPLDKKSFETISLWD